MIVEFVCDGGHKYTLAGPEIKEAEITEFERSSIENCNKIGCNRKMYRMGGTPPAASPATDIQQF
jgi:hypothetical protein